VPEPPGFTRDQDGHVDGFSKPNATPDPYDAAAAVREGLPDGTTRDLLDILCQLSREHGIDWEISHDESGGPVGYIRRGVTDAKVDGLMDLFAELPGNILRDLEAEVGPGDFRPSASRGGEGIMDDDDDAEPPILPFRPRGG
jgi:hypothetical protein